jgi:radical SAM protein with 4Fe4S-binding SPASM domain
MASSLKFVGSHGIYNILQVDDRYCGVLQSFGPFTVDDRHILYSPKTLWADRPEDIEEQLERNWRSHPLYSPIPLVEKGPPELIEVELIETCNLRCIMCHVSYEEMTKTRLEPTFVNRLRGLEGKWVKLGAMYEPVAHPQFATIARELTELGLKIDLTSNGTLFTPKLISRIKDCNFRLVTISFDGARRETYEKIRRLANYDRAMERILAFKKAVQQVNPKVFFGVNYTVLNSNIDEIVEAVDLWESHGFDHLGFISMVLPVSSDTIASESPQLSLPKIEKQMLVAASRVVDRKYRITLSSPWFHNESIRAHYPNNIGMAGAGLVVSDHPDALFPVAPTSYFQNGPFPGMHVNCRSLFKFVRINYDGAVRLCQTFTVGSIYEKDLLSIWNSPEAEAWRANVQKDVGVCHACEYFKFCIRANDVDYTDKTVFASNGAISGGSSATVSNERVDMIEKSPPLLHGQKSILKNLNQRLGGRLHAILRKQPDRDAKITASSVHGSYGPDGLLKAAEPGWHAETPPRYPQILTFTFRRPQRFSEIGFLPQAGQLGRGPRKLGVEISDDANVWKEVAVIENDCNARSESWRDHPLGSTVNTKNVRIKILSNCGDPAFLTLRGVRFKE